ncbi:putative apyrase 7 [Bienertia sinuspersici]
MEPQTPPKIKTSNSGSFQTQKIVKNCLIFLAILLVLAGVYYGYGLFGESKPFFTVVVDCGSTGTRLNVYEWKINDERKMDLPILLHSFPHESAKNPSWKNGCEYHCMQTEPGLDKFVGNFSGVRVSLAPLLRWAERVVPNDRHRDTPIFVLATAGLRRLAMEDSNRVLEDLGGVIKEYKFKWRRDWIRVLSGREEAYYGWVALNYKLGYLNRSSSQLPTLGLLDLGGSSLQIVIEANELRESKHFLVSKIGVVEHQLMTYSLPAFGLNKAFDRTVDMVTQVKSLGNDAGFDVRHPCLSSYFVKNYTCSVCSKSESLLRLVGDPNWEKCKMLAQAAALNTSISDWSEPLLSSSCWRRPPHEGKNILNVAINTKPRMQYHALSGFFVVYKKLNLTTKANMTKIWETAQHLCSSTWDDETNVSGSQYCFKVLYLASLIDDGLCLGDADITFGPGDISWTLGASLVEGERMWRTTIGPRTLIPTSQFSILSSSIFLFTILVVLVCVVYYCQIKLPMPRRRSAVVGLPLPSFTHSKHQP